MPYCAPSVNGAQCQAYSCEPSLRGTDGPAHPGISSLVRRGRRPGFTRRNLTVGIRVFGLRADVNAAPAEPVPNRTAKSGALTRVPCPRSALRRIKPAAEADVGRGRAQIHLAVMRLEPGGGL